MGFHPCTTVTSGGYPPWLLHMRLESAALLLLPQGKQMAGFGAQLVKTKPHVKCVLKEASQPWLTEEQHVDHERTYLGHGENSA